MTNKSELIQHCIKIRDAVLNEIQSDLSMYYINPHTLKGACAVVSRLIFESFTSDVYDIFFCKGKYKHNGRGEDHCWLELTNKDGNKSYVIDPTISQFNYKIGPVLLIDNSEEMFKLYKCTTKIDKKDSTHKRFQNLFMWWILVQKPVPNNELFKKIYNNLFDYSLILC